MALNAAQIARRKHTLGGSDIACLMNGDADKIMHLWREKIGDEAPEDLSNVWPVQLGLTTEQLNLDWYERKSKQLVTRRGDVAVHPFFSWAAVTLDGWIAELSCPIECKHTGGREPLEVIIARYQPQMQWQMEITGADQCALSVIMAAAEPVIEFVNRDAEYADVLLQRGTQFMAHVRDRTPPVDMPAVPPPIEASRDYDMTGHNEWANHAAVWLENKPAVALCDDASKILKSLVPPDAKRAYGHGVSITRSLTGTLSLREKTK